MDTLVSLHFEDLNNFEFPFPESSVYTWIRAIVDQEEKKLQQLSFIFCSDEFLHEINLNYLNHDTYTDIITFPYGTPPVIEGDLFISVERVRENAINFKATFNEELLRVMIHGVLHLCGYNDKASSEKELMRRKEEEAIRIFKKRNKL